MVLASWRHSPGAWQVQRNFSCKANLRSRHSQDVQGQLSSRQRLLHDYLQGLYIQAAAPRQLQAPLPPSGAGSCCDEPTRSQAQPTRNAGGSSPTGPSHGPLTAHGSPEPAVWSSAAVLLQESKNPVQLDFEVMYQQAAVWRFQHLSCHIPRNCFDAPPLLGAWVRHMRRLHRAARLTQWQVDRLNLLGFEWRLDDASAKWINMYHQMRRYKALNGHTAAPPGDTQGGVHPTATAQLARWLADQAHLYAAGKLTEQQTAMLQRLGVALTIPMETADQMVQLQGLNAHERKLLRRKFRDGNSTPGRSQGHRSRARSNSRPVGASTPAAATHSDAS